MAHGPHPPAWPSGRRGGAREDKGEPPLGADDERGALPQGGGRETLGCQTRRRNGALRHRGTQHSEPSSRRLPREVPTDGTTGPPGSCQPCPTHRSGRPDKCGGESARMPSGPQKPCVCSQRSAIGVPSCFSLVPRCQIPLQTGWVHICLGQLQWDAPVPRNQVRTCDRQSTPPRPWKAEKKPQTALRGSLSLDKGSPS